MNEDQVAKMIADTLKWAASRADSPAIANIEIAEGEPNVILFNVMPGEPFALKVEAL